MTDSTSVVGGLSESDFGLIGARGTEQHFNEGDVVFLRQIPLTLFILSNLDVFPFSSTKAVKMKRCVFWAQEIILVKWRYSTRIDVLPRSLQWKIPHC